MAEYGTTYSDWLRQNQQGGLAGMGSQPMQQPQQPAPAPVAPAPVAPAPAVAPTTRNPTRALQEVRGAQVQGANETAASFLREGDAKADASTARAGVIGAATPRARRYADAADATHEANRGRQDKALSWMDQDMETLRKPPVEPERWQKAVGILSGIVGATAQGYLGRMGGGIAYGLQALQDHVYSSVRNQLEAKDEAGENLKHTEKYLENLQKDSSNELDVASKLAANHWFATSKELERLAEEAKVPEYRETAQRLAIEAQSKGRGILEKNYAEQIEQARAAAAARVKKALTPADILKLEKAQLENEGLRLANDAARVKAAGGADAGAPAPLDRSVVNPKIWDSVNDTEKAKFRTADWSFRAFDRDASKLEQLLADHGTEAWGDVSKEMESLQASLLGSYKEIKELGALDNGVIEVVDRAIGDPTAFLKGGEGVRAKIRATRESLRHGLEARAGGLGLGESAYGKEAPPDIRTRDGAPATPGGAAPAADPNAPVAMVDTKTGRRYMIPPARVPAAQAQGLELASAVGAQFDQPPAPPAAPAPAPAPTVGDVYAPAPADVAEAQRLAEDEDLIRRQLAGAAL